MAKGNGRRFSKITKNPKNRLLSVLKGLAVYALIGLAALIFFVNLSGGTPTGNEVPISQIVQDVKNGKIDKITVEGDKVVADYKEPGKELNSNKESTDSIYQVFKNANVDPGNVTIAVKDTSMQQAWISILGTVVPVVGMIVLIFLIFRQA